MKIIIAEDDQYYSNYIEYSVKLSGDHLIDCCRSSGELLEKISENTDVVLLDYHLDESDGSSTFTNLRIKYPSTDIIVISGQQDINVAISLLSKGAYDYIVKNEDAKNRIVHSVQKIQRQKELESTISQLQGEVSSKYNLESILISKDKSFDNIYKLIDKASKSNINVSIYGQTGTGKELVSR